MDLRIGATRGRGCHVDCGRELEESVHGDGDYEDAIISVF
jgi:hypothetical protein